MKHITHKIFFFFFIFLADATFAQPGWPSIEVERMYLNAQQYTDAGNYKDAVTTYKQAIALAPQVMVLYRELGNALYLSGMYKEAEQVLVSLVDKQEADVKCYQLLAAAFAAQHDTKRALATLKRGIEKFSSPGILYHEAGKIYTAGNDPKNALNEWLNGIEKDPSFAVNYFDAAMIYLNSENVMWGLLYGEMFLAMAHDSKYDAAMKNKLFPAYKTMFDNIVDGGVPKYGMSSESFTVNTFMDAVLNTYRSLTPIISDGITTEKITMLRVRFLMEWFSVYDKKYPFSFFSYQDKLIRNGRFDVYNEWLFGNAESAVEYNTWNTFHEGDMQRFLQWRSSNLFVPLANEFYNDRNKGVMFEKKKK